MSLFTDASLVLVPSGIKNQKIYSVKPTDGSGDLTFSRASSASRINSSGLVEKVRTNELTYSNDFSNAAWTKVRATLTGGQSDPFGGTDAWKMECSGSTGSVQIAQNANIGNGSIYAKAGNVSSFNIWVGLNVTFDLSTGTITSGAANGKIESVGGGWYRCTAINPSATVHNPNFTAASLGEYVYIAFAQGELGDIATDPITTLGSAVSVGPVSGLPRLDYSGGASCPSLLLEPERMNLATYSEQFDNAAWTKIQSSITANSVIGPDGYSSADTFTADGTLNEHQLRSNGVISLTSGTTYTTSIFVKAGTNNFVQFVGSGTPYLSTVYANFDVANGVIGDVGAGATASIVSYGNGWYRCSMTATAQATTTTNTFLLDIVTSNTSVRGEANELTTNVYVWGAQLEAGTYATSYIPTLSTAVTRVKDAASKTGISSLIGATEGTMFVEVKATFNSRNGRFMLLQGATNQFIELVGLATKKIQAFVYNGATQANIQSTTLYSTGDTLKIAFAYKANDFVLYVNGVQQGTDTSGAIPSSLDTILFNNYTAAGYDEANAYKQAILFPTRLSNDSLASLTTL